MLLPNQELLHLNMKPQKNDELWLGGGFKHFLFSPLLGEMIQFD